MPGDEPVHNDPVAHRYRPRSTWARVPGQSGRHAHPVDRRSPPARARRPRGFRDESPEHAGGTRRTSDTSAGSGTGATGATGAPAWLGAAVVAVRRGPPRGGPGGRAGHGGTGRQGGSRLLRGPGGGPRRTVHRPDGYGRPAAAHDVRTGAPPGGRRRGGRGRPGGGSAGGRPLPLPVGLPALGSAPRRRVRQPAVTPTPRPVPPAAGVRGTGAVRSRGTGDPGQGSAPGQGQVPTARGEGPAGRGKGQRSDSPAVRQSGSPAVRGRGAGAAVRRPVAGKGPAE